MKNRQIMILFALGFFALFSIAEAVSPPPDGGYANFNTAEGQNALFSLTTGQWNTALGGFTLWRNTDGSFNTAVGTAALLLNVGNQAGFQGIENTAVGAAALLSNTTGSDNTAVGAFALFSNIATGNTAIGFEALFSNTTGGTLGTTQGFDVGPNVAVGSEALKNNTIGSANTAVGYQALGNFIAGNVGTDRGQCTAIGFQALANTDGANGGIADSGFGYQALFHNTDGAENVAIGDRCLFGNQTGSRNTAVGGGALSANTSGSFNTIVGNDAGRSITGDGNVCIGAFSDVAFAAETNTTHIANIGDTSQGGGLVVTVLPSANNELGYVPSSRRYKEDIKPMDKTSEAIFALKPVSFRYKKKVDRAQTHAFGLVAEDVERVDSNLVARNREGQPESVRYEYINAMLLNEFLKEHKTVQAQSTAIAALKKEIRRLTASVKDQAAQIQKVNTRIEVNRPHPVLVRNHQ